MGNKPPFVNHIPRCPFAELYSQAGRLKIIQNGLPFTLAAAQAIQASLPLLNLVSLPLLIGTNQFFARFSSLSLHLQV